LVLVEQASQLGDLGPKAADLVFHSDELIHAATTLDRVRSTTMRFVTRKNAAVDRVACPWLIRRFIDDRAEFLYVDPKEVSRVAQEQGAVPYDVDGVELGHVDGRCSFESILRKYGLDDPALRRMAVIVHGADIEADVDKTPEAAGLKAIAIGFRRLYGDRDDEKLEAQMGVYDALYAWCQEQEVKRPA
jgi:hypothetical protein